MHKILAIAIVCGGVIIVHLLLLVVMPILADFASTANLTMTASSDLTKYPGSAEGVLVAPWVLWFVPGALGIVIIVGILRSS